MDFLDRIAAEKKLEVAAMPHPQLSGMEVARTRPSLYQIIHNAPERMHVIGEVKRASPSKGAINMEVDIVKQAKSYEEAGVSAISVLTDEVFFKGSIDDLQVISQEVRLPILCKDFIISEKQLLRAKQAGASIVLLIVALLLPQQLKELYRAAQELELEVLVEVHNQEELLRAQALQPTLVGINNRDLKSFQVDIAISEQLAPPSSKTVYVSESGFFGAADVARIKEHYHAVLVGEALMSTDDPKEKAQELQVSRI